MTPCKSAGAAPAKLDNLSPKHELALQALLVEHTVSKAAGQAEVRERTIYRWLDEPDFSRAYRKARRLLGRPGAAAPGDGRLGASDETALTMLCVTWARWRDAVRVLRHCGEFYETIGSGWKPVVKRRPEAQIARECEATLLRLLQEFGLSPAARPRIEATAFQKEEEVDPNSAEGSSGFWSCARPKSKVVTPMNLATRLRRLEHVTGSVVCPSWGRVPGTERWPDGTEAPVNLSTRIRRLEVTPAIGGRVCPDCGRIEGTGLLAAAVFPNTESSLRRRWGRRARASTARRVACFSSPLCPSIGAAESDADDDAHCTSCAEARSDLPSRRGSLHRVRRFRWGRGNAFARRGHRPPIGSPGASHLLLQMVWSLVWG